MVVDFKLDKLIRIILISGIILSWSCVEKKTEKKLQTPPPAKDPGPRHQTRAKAKSRQGVWHTVEPGQTLWRICKTYGVDMELVIQENDIEDPSQISAGQKIFIPGATSLKYVPPSFQPSQPEKPPPKPTIQERPDEFPPEKQTASGKLLWPLDGGKIFSPFGMRNGKFHEGIDISAPEGTAIFAADDGRVVYADNRIRGYGNMIVLKHSGNLSTVYAHNRINLVQEGDFVRRGQKIAEVGRTGTATGTHLHFEVREGKSAVDPLKYLERKK